MHKALDVAANEKLRDDKKKAATIAEHAQPKKATKKAPTPKAVTFPATIRINAYGFIGLRKCLLEGLGWSKSMRLQIDKNADGSATLRKA